MKRMSIYHLNPHQILCFSLCILLWVIEIINGNILLCMGRDTLSRDESLSDSQTLISKGGTFELGFFTTGTSNSHKLYLAIWYKDFDEKTTVWIANRESPLPNTPSSKLKISPNGNLGLFDEYETNFWSSNLMSTLPESVEAVLLDNGNFVLRDDSRPNVVFWQSFDHPTDTWLPGSKIVFRKSSGGSQRLVSWKNKNDPSPGMFSVAISQDSSAFEFYLEWNMSSVYWRSGEWKRNVFSSIPELSYILLFKFVSNEEETSYTYSVLNDKVFTRLVISESGRLEQLTSFQSHHQWDTTTSRPENMCGPFGILDSNNTSNPCTCLEGFEPFVEARTSSWPGGCSRKAHVQCGSSNSTSGEEDGFLEISDLMLPANPIQDLHDQNEKNCRSACLKNCSCVAYAFGDGGCVIWNGALFGLAPLPKTVSSSSNNNNNNNKHLFVRVASSELHGGKGKGKIIQLIGAVIFPVAVLVSVGFLGYLYTRRSKQKGHKDLGNDLLSFDFNSSGHLTDDGGNLREAANKSFNLPMFTYASVSAATKNFSEDNKLGEGGFGPVYKGKLLNGQEIALKRLSKRSGQGFQEFRNEILLIAQLQHRNLVRLFGCCIDQNESILIYEYMPNKSLDFFLFDSNKKETLDWETRVRIIDGIAQGILYLHQYSRLRVIHRDLKASNILLDDNMNPKISDFGMARIFGGNDSQTNTKRIVGTYGYMAPEYALEGLFSVKSDVFSFGVLVLEIISGKKNTGFYQTDSLNLIGHAWELWTSNRGIELMDPAVGSPPVSAVLRCINVGLLCVQENTNDRPNMSGVISMIGSGIAPLPAPKQPAFSTRRMVDTALVTDVGTYSVNGLTVSMIQAR